MNGKFLVSELTQFVGPKSENCSCSLYPVKSTSDGIGLIDLASTYFFFGKWAIPGEHVAKLFGLTDEPITSAPVSCETSVGESKSPAVAGCQMQCETSTGTAS